MPLTDKFREELQEKADKMVEELKEALEDGTVQFILDKPLNKGLMLTTIDEYLKKR